MQPNDDQRAQQREHSEPREGTRAVPRFVLIWIAALIVWGVGYYTWQIGKPMLGGDSRSVVELPAAGAAVDGEALFGVHCSACHQASGQGVPGAFPPLVGSHWVQGDPAVPVAIVHDGLQGPIEVEGQSFQGVMPAFAGKLSNAEIAGIITYARQAWGNDADPVDASLVESHAEEFGERGAWSALELSEHFETP
ncbi:MAG: c-type cytochrome [Halomonas sp.]|uniref:c-type cytochrome n=1 Tax=Halomonas sp. TaxID=1486246 RepID=UPI003F8DEC83